MTRAVSGHSKGLCTIPKCPHRAVAEGRCRYHPAPPPVEPMTAREAVAKLRNMAVDLLAMQSRDAEAICVVIDHLTRVEQALELVISAARSAIGDAPTAATLSPGRSW